MDKAKIAKLCNEIEDTACDIARITMNDVISAESRMIFDKAKEIAAEVSKQPTIEAEPVRHGRWIPCSERLPEKTGYYLVCDSTAKFDNIRGRQDVSKFVIGRHGGHWYGAIRREYITHWMPLPEPPEKE